MSLDTQKIQRTFKSAVYRKIMRFFLENQGSVDTPRGVSTWTNENILTVRPALENLARLGLLKAHRTSSTVGYSCAVSRKQFCKIVPGFEE